jgi:hypothetical protein
MPGGGAYPNLSLHQYEFIVPPGAITGPPPIARTDVAFPVFGAPTFVVPLVVPAAKTISPPNNGKLDAKKLLSSMFTPEDNLMNVPLLFIYFKTSLSRSLLDNFSWRTLLGNSWHDFIYPLHQYFEVDCRSKR